MPEIDDIKLLREYARDNSQEAFAELVRRHINLVYSVAYRFTGDFHEAQDIAQVVFIIMAQKADRMREGAVLQGWLYETTRLTSSRFLRTKNRRQNREQEAHMRADLNESDSENVWQHLAPLLEEAMTQLGEKDRTMVALRFFENKSGAEAAVVLGLNEWAVHKRMSRAVEKLRAFFVERGINVSSDAMTTAISTHSIQIAPAGVASTVAAAAMLKGSAASSSTATLIKGTLKLMAWTKTKIAIVTGACILLAGGTTTVVVISRNQSESAKSPEELKAGSIARMNFSKQWMVAFMMFAEDNGHQFPSSFKQAASFFPGGSDRPDIKPDQFEIVYHGSSQSFPIPPNNLVVMREKRARHFEKVWSRVYAFADGHIEMHGSTNGNYDDWEKLHIVASSGQ